MKLTHEEAERRIREAIERDKKENWVLRVVYTLAEKEGEYALCRSSRKNKVENSRGRRH